MSKTNHGGLVSEDKYDEILGLLDKAEATLERLRRERDGWKFTAEEATYKTEAQAAIIKAMKPYLEHMKSPDNFCEANKHSDYPCTCGLQALLEGV